LPVITGNPPAAAFGMNGMIVSVITNVISEPEEEARNHSARSRNQLAPRGPNTGYIHDIGGPLLM